VTDEELAAQLGAIFGHEPSEVQGSRGFIGMACGRCFTDWPCPVVRKIERDMLPVVRRYGNQQAADELDTAADNASGPEAATLRRRATALRGR
jgi:hypothetical protein